MLTNYGFMSKEEPGPVFEYRDKFVYEVRRPGYSGDYTTFQTNNLNSYDKVDALKAVYQEVIGPERIKAVKQWMKKAKEYEKKQEEIRKKAAEKAEKNKQLRQLKKLEQAKKIIAELEADTSSEG